MSLRWMAFLLPAALLAADAKLTEDERIELIRGLTAEYATAKVLLPRSRKPLPLEPGGKYDKAVWSQAAKEFGPAARAGDMVKVTKVSLEGDKIVFEINGGVKDKKKWYERIEVGMGNSTTPVGGNQSTSAPAGTNLVLEFHKPIPAVPAAEVKKMLATVLDFEKRTATQNVAEQLPPEIQAAVKENRAIEGMDRDQVILAMGRPVRKSRETKDGMELEDWIYGQAPGKITFVTFNGPKVVKVKETYAGLGGATAPSLKPQ